MFDTAVTRMFGTRLPIVAGGLMWLSEATYVAAGARAGIMSYLTAASFPEPRALRAEIAKCRALADGHPFGVNVSMLPKLVPGDKVADTFALIADEGIRFVETSGRNPAPYLDQLKDAGITVLHKVPGVRYAVSAQTAGVDMVSIVGAECGGHPGLELIGSMVNQALAGRRLDIPYLIGGGIGCGSQIIGALASGASGVVIGTRFLVAEEIQAHDGYKQALISAGETDTELTMASVRNTVRTLRNETTRLVTELEASSPDIGIDDLLPLVSGKIGRKAYETGDVSHGLLSAGQALGFTDAIAPLAEIVRALEDEMQHALERLRQLQTTHGEQGDVRA
ncbi:nitronate monooxygenase [Breoghania sp. L-A4]|uniref:NAD(P)H-dependent flavin oxidoreductase n=1 Tax=Breoghania sp. L-A4 TaxID=2304600 RepID=UPI000E36033F|nr:nitronate monooxygenase [Breoghania sp. L-A4]AXS42711.1 nitronate monooxygenase [Breoghania sp. L-A4]